MARDILSPDPFVPIRNGGIFSPTLTNIGTILPFSGSRMEDARDWITQFEWLADVNNWNSNIRAALFSNYLTGVARDWYGTLNIESRKTYGILRQAFMEAFRPVTREVDYLHELIQRVQKEDETVEAYGYSKIKLCTKSNEGMSDQQKMNFFIDGLKFSIRKYVADKKPRTLMDAFNLAREKENSAKKVSPKEPEKAPANTNMVQEIRKMMTEMKTEMKMEILQEVGRQKEETIRRMENMPRAYQPYQPRQPQKQARFKWTEEGKPICQKCHRPGHVQRECQAKKTQPSSWDERKRLQSEKPKWEPRRPVQDDKKRLEERREPAKEDKIHQVD
jgi:hypothetical protein